MKGLLIRSTGFAQKPEKYISLEIKKKKLFESYDWLGKEIKISFSVIILTQESDEKFL